MCGIVGFIGNKYIGNDNDLNRMLFNMRHRGPDSQGIYTNVIDNTIINLGHVRLSIIDTSDNGSQPMISRDGRYALIYNGEIYNYLDIKAELISAGTDHQWVSGNDTEVLLAGIELWGLEETVKKTAGMFAFALWDNVEKKLTLVRDRIGEKPLHYGYQQGTLLFGSELNAIKQHSHFENKIDYKVAVEFLKNGFVPGLKSIYTNFYKVPPGSLVTFGFEQLQQSAQPKIKYYWRLTDVVKKEKLNKYQGSYEQAVQDLENILVKTIKQQSISDVPIGAFLSGGIDSSVVCAVMKKHVKNDLRTFSIGMPKPGINEAINARAVAEHIESVHVDKYLDISQIKHDLEKILSLWDEPFADSSQIPTYYVSKLAREYVTVSISGDGADEFLYGYAHYNLYDKFKRFKFLNYTPLPLVVNTLGKLSPGLKRNNKYKRISSFLGALGQKNSYELNQYWKNKFRGFNVPVKSAEEILEADNQRNADFDYAGYYDALKYLPEDILVKVDRATMAVSLESRAPFVDHRVVEFVSKLPKSFKFQDNVTKRILKDVLYKYVPKELVDRPKQGFAIPISEWLKTDLRQWANEILNGISLQSEFWKKEEVLLFWNEHLEGKFDHGERLWGILVLELFFRRSAIS